MRSKVSKDNYIFLQYAIGRNQEKMFFKILTWNIAL